jgi:hypothetical protein
MAGKVEEMQDDGDDPSIDTPSIYDPSLSFSSHIFEYRWPLDDRDSPTYILQEQIAEYLEIRGFSRRYPDLSRRPVEVEEREFLVELGIVTETQSNLGLVALQSFEVYQLMFEDYPHKFSHYMEVLEQRYFMELVGNMKAEKQRLAKQQSERNIGLSKEMCMNTAKFNKKIGDIRKKRKCMYDYQTKIYHTFRRKVPELSLTGDHHYLVSRRNMYPAVILPGQHRTCISTYAESLHLFPIGTVTDVSTPLPVVKGESVIEKPPVSLKTKACIDNITEIGTNSGSTPYSSVSIPASYTQDSSITEEEEYARRSVLDKIQRVESASCSICRKGKAANSVGIAEELIECSKCHCKNHPSCLGIGSTCISSIKSYPWECNDCKLCWICKSTENEDQVCLDSS